MYNKVDQNYFFNKNTRIIGIDDSPFKRGDEFSYLVAVLMRVDGTIERVEKRRITIDGDDSSNAIISIIRIMGEGVRMIMLQGISFGGFNLADIDLIFNETKTPVAVIIDRKPNMDNIRRALMKHFSDWEYRFQKLNREMYWDGRNYYQFAGIPNQIGIRFIQRFIRTGKYPEPLRIAHLVASILPC